MAERASALWPETCHGRWMSEECERGLVSVIIPTYNRAHLVTEAMDSVWAQPYRPIELIIVDDGSTDDTREVVEKWGKKCAVDGAFELRYFHQENKGCPASRNLGLIESRGEFIQHLDSDDLMLPCKLDDSVPILERAGEVSWVYGSFLEDRDGVIVQRSSPDVGRAPELETVASRNMPPPLPLWRRRLAVLVGPWEESFRERADDWDLHMRAIPLIQTAVNLHEPVCTIRIHCNGRLSDQCWSQEALAECLRAWRRAFQVARHHGREAKGLLEVYEWHALLRAVQATGAGYASEARRHLREAMELQPFTFRGRMLAVLIRVAGLVPLCLYRPTYGAARAFVHRIRKEEPCSLGRTGRRRYQRYPDAGERLGKRSLLSGIRTAALPAGKR